MTITKFHFCIIIFGLTDVLYACSTERAQKGAEECQKAASETYEENQSKYIMSPQATACCMMFHMSDCVNHALKSAGCNADQNEEVKELQGKSLEMMPGDVSQMFQQLGKALCGDTSKSSCSHLSKEFEEAKKEITSINGIGVTTPSAFLSFFLLAILTYVGNW